MSEIIVLIKIIRVHNN